MTTTTLESATRTADASGVTLHAPSRGTGFRNLFGKEMRAWWRTRTWQVQLGLFLLMAVGIPGSAVFQMHAAGTLAEDSAAAYVVFLMLHMVFAAGSAIITAQGAIVGEREAGTAAWILSKPVSRTSFVLAKAAALSLNFLLVGVLLPAAAMWGVWSVFGVAPSLSAMGFAVLGMAVGTLFYLTLTLALGVFFSTRAAVAGGAFFVFFVFTQLGQSLTDYVPGGIPFRVWEVLQGQPLGSPSNLLIAAGASALFLALAVLRFRSIEL